MYRKPTPNVRHPLKALIVVILTMALAQIQVAWASGEPVSPAPAHPLFTPEESAWLADHPEITIAVNEAWPPMDYVDTDGMPHGIGAGVIRALNARLGDRLKIIPLPWSEMVAAVTEKRIDALMDITPRPDREPFFNFTKPYLAVPHSIVARKDAPYYADLSSLKGKTVGVERQFFVAPVIREKYPEIQLTLFDTTSDALDAVSKGMIDAYVGNRAVAMYIVEREVIPNLKVHGKIKETSSINAIGVRKDRPILRDILQKALDDLNRSEISAILRKWVDLDEEGPVPTISLSPGERAWLEEHPVLRLGYDTDWPPVEYVDKEGKLVGMSADFMQKLSALMGIEIRPIKPQGWDTTLEGIREGAVDILFSVTRTPQREAFLLFSEPYLRSPGEEDRCGQGIRQPRLPENETSGTGTPLCE